ncbi:MAG: Protein GrpE [Berkelbacteria bacterium GW2011_GWA2_38_9]|uniref:Protein GrpE n=1 Tax=Berkelbacteria bacterium GW2011_GWA2_38_9 TaxID=1618334 RepID=A0A0G0PJN5_9BACT|nr:MAG: Protein GrpE [Berkelbacteria bacterium GW2011_GWA2_38_9]
MPKSKKIVELEQQVGENLAGWQRTLADLENLKKRTIVEKEEYRKYCLEDAVLQILPVLDNFKLATNHVPEDQKDSSWLVGIMHIQKQLSDVIVSWGIEEINIEAGDEFNPEMADAIESVESADIKSGHIIRVSQSAYRMNGKVIRHAKVVVAE